LCQVGCCSIGCLLQHAYVRGCERESKHAQTATHCVCVCAEILITRSRTLLQSASRVTIHVSGSAALLFFYCVMLRDVATTDVMVSSRVWQAVAAWGVCCNTLTCVCVCERVSTLTLQHTVCVCAEILSTRSWSSLQSASRVTIHVSCSAALLFFLMYDVAGCCNHGCDGFKLREAGCCIGCVCCNTLTCVGVVEREPARSHFNTLCVCVCVEILITRSCSSLQSASRFIIHVSGSAAPLFFYGMMLRDVATTDVMVSSWVRQVVAAWGVCCNTLTCVCVRERAITLTLNTLCVCVLRS